MRLAIPLVAALTAIALVACGGGDDDEAAAPCRRATILTAGDAPGTKPDPVETRQTTADLDEFIVALSELAVDPTQKRRPRSFRRLASKEGGCGHTFLRRDAFQHRPSCSSVRLSSSSLKTGRLAHATGFQSGAFEEAMPHEAGSEEKRLPRADDIADAPGIRLHRGRRGHRRFVAHVTNNSPKAPRPR